MKKNLFITTNKFLMLILLIVTIITLSSCRNGDNLDRWDPLTEVPDILPVIKLYNENSAEPTRDTWVNSELTIRNLDGEYEFSSHPVQMRGRGNSSWNGPPVPKLPYRFRFFSGDENGVLGLAESRDFVLLANAFDNSHLRNYIAHTLAGNIFAPESFQPSAIHVQLFLNGDFQGIYLLTEQMQVHENRVNLPGDNDWYLEMDGRASREQEEGVGFIWANFGTRRMSVDLTRTPNYAQRTPQQVQELSQLLEYFNRALLRQDNSFVNYIDLDSFVNYFIVQVLMQNPDIGWSSVHFTVINDVIKMGPVWDFDTASMNERNRFFDARYHFGQNAHEVILAIEMQNHNGWFRQLMNNSDFADAFYERWNEVVANEIQDILDREQELIDKLLPIVKYENARWSYHWLTNTRPASRGMYRHFDFMTKEVVENSDFQTYVSNLFTFFRLRIPAVTSELDRLAQAARN